MHLQRLSLIPPDDVIQSSVARVALNSSVCLIKTINSCNNWTYNSCVKQICCTMSFSGDWCLCLHLIGIPIILTGKSTQIITNWILIYRSDKLFIWLCLLSALSFRPFHYLLLSKQRDWVVPWIPIRDCVRIWFNHVAASGTRRTLWSLGISRDGRSTGYTSLVSQPAQHHLWRRQNTV